MNMFSKKVICLVLIISLMAAFMPIDTHMSTVIAEGKKSYSFQQVLLQSMAFDYDTNTYSDIHTNIGEEKHFCRL